MDSTEICGRVIGVGYAGLTVEVFVQRLVAVRVRQIVDVRLNAISRKPGFSKQALAAAVSEAGIGYVHAPELGNPRWNRSGFVGRPDEVAAARARFAAMLTADRAAERLREIAEAASAGGVALLCVEADERACHRYVILRELRRYLGAPSTAAC